MEGRQPTTSSHHKQQQIIAGINQKLRNVRANRTKSPPARAVASNSQDITSPIYRYDEKTRDLVVGLLGIDEGGGRGSVAVSDASWVTSSVSFMAGNTPHGNTPPPCVAGLTICNSNIGMSNTPVTTATPTPEIDKCTELEAMRQGLARIQAGHGRPSDFLPEYRHTAASSHVDPYIRKTLEDIRQSIREMSMSGSQALQQELDDIRQNMKELSLSGSAGGGMSEFCRRSGPTLKNNSGGSNSLIINMLTDIQESIRALNNEDGGGSGGGGGVKQVASVSSDPAIMGVLDEIRRSVVNLQETVEDVAGGAEAVVPSQKSGEDNEVMEALNEIRVSIRTLQDEVGTEDADPVETNPVIEALNDIRQSINVLTNEMGIEAEETPVNEVMETLQEIRSSVRMLGGDTRSGRVNKVCNPGDMSCQLEDIREILAQMVEHYTPRKNINTDDTTIDTDGDKRSRERNKSKKKERSRSCRKNSNSRKKSKPRKGKQESESSECCTDTCKIGCTCDKIINYLIEKNCQQSNDQYGNGGGGGSGGGGGGGGSCAPSIHYICPPMSQPPTFIAPMMGGTPRNMMRPSMMPLRYPSCPPLPLPPPTSVAQTSMSFPPPLPQAPSYQCSLNVPPPLQPTMSQQSLGGASLNMAGSMNMPCPQPGPAILPPQVPLASMSLPPSSMGSGGGMACPCPPPPQGSVSFQQPCPPPPPLANNGPAPPQTSGNCSHQSPPMVLCGTVNDQPMAFTLSFAGTSDKPAGGGGGGGRKNNRCTATPNYENRTFLCTQVGQ